MYYFYYYTSYVSLLSADLCIIRHGSKQTRANRNKAIRSETTKDTPVITNHPTETDV